MSALAPGPALALPVTLALILPGAAAAQLPPGALVERLDNGLTVIAAPVGSVPMATVEVVLRGGASTQVEEGEEGLPHVLEHMLFRSYGGGSQVPFGYYAGQIGAIYNGTTSQEAVTYFLVLPNGNVEEGLDLLADLVASPRFDAEDLDIEKPVIRGELERGVSDPEYLLHVAVEMALWGPAFRQRNPIGNVLTIMDAGTPLLDGFYRRWYVPSNAAVVVAGAIDPAAVVGAARTAFGRWQGSRAPLPAVPAATAALERDTVVVVQAGASDVTVLVRWEGPSLADEPRSAAVAEVLAAMVNQPGSGTQQRLVERGHFQAVSLFSAPDTRSGTLSLVGRTTPDQLLEASRALRQEMDVLGRGWAVSEPELRAALRRIELRERLLDESAQVAAHRLAEAWAQGVLHEGGEAQVTLDEVRGFVDRWVAGRPRVTGFRVPPEIVRTRLEELGVAAQLWVTP